MEVNRNQWFAIGLILLFLGLQFRMIDSYVLNEKSAKFIAEKMKRGDSNNMTLLLNAGSPQHRTVKPPTWLGWVLISVGGVIVLNCFAMRKPGG